LCILIWTIALMIGGVATSFALIIICRILLGIGEGFYYPLQSVFIKNWFPKQERGRANAAWIVGQSVAPAIAMPFFTWWIGTHGWRSNFFLCAALGLIPLWLLWRYVADKPEQHKSISEQELAYIKAGQETESAGSSES
ncbi:MFS transporter, partial [Salmonella enterica subsp. enterica serovar Senftenberg]